EYFAHFVDNPSTVSTTFYWLAVRGEGYTRQLFQAAKNRYVPHDSFLESVLGLRIEDIVNMLEWFYNEIERKMNNYREKHIPIMNEIYQDVEKLRQELVKKNLSDDDFKKEFVELRKTKKGKEILARKREITRKIADVFIFAVQEIDDKFGSEKASRFLERFSASWGNINDEYSRPENFNEILSKPLILVDQEKIWIPIPTLLSQVAYASLHYDFTRNPSFESYKDDYNRISGELLEEQVAEVFRKIFPAARILTKYYIGSSSRSMMEGDVLIEFEGQYIVIECKSKKLTMLAKNGDIDEIKDSFSKAIQAAYNQGQKRRDLLVRERCDVYDAQARGNVITTFTGVQKADVSIIVVTRESFGPLATDLSHFLEKDESEEYPWVVNFLDLQNIARFVQSPYEFLLYLKRRVKLQGKAYSADEFVYFGAFFNKGLFIDDKSPEKGEISLDPAFVEQFDKYDNYSYRGMDKPKPVITWISSNFRLIIEWIRKLIGSENLADIAIVLMGNYPRELDKLMQMIKDQKFKSLNDGEEHIATFSSESTLYDGKIGFFVYSSFDDHSSRDVSLFAKCSIIKKQYKLSKVMGFGIDANDQVELFHEFKYLNFP
ncbi:MAG: hypothetical protein ACFFD4_24305, partial [Candidatus Odinarchaeota archaeon]